MGPVVHVENSHKHILYLSLVRRSTACERGFELQGCRFYDIDVVAMNGEEDDAATMRDIEGGLRVCCEEQFFDDGDVGGCVPYIRVKIPLNFHQAIREGSTCLSLYGEPFNWLKGVGIFCLDQTKTNGRKAGVNPEDSHKPDYMAAPRDTVVLYVAAPRET